MRDQKQKILYVEDDPANMALVTRLLVYAGYEVIGANNGLSGVNMAAEENPDLIIMDIDLPGMNGNEAATRIKSIGLCRNTPIVAFTANDQPVDRERSLVAGCDGYMSKPLDVGTFAAEIGQYLKGKREKVEEDKDSVLQSMDGPG